MKTDNKGVTLVEVVVTSLIMSILVTVGATVYSMYNREFSQALTRSRLHTLSDIVSLEIGRQVRSGSMVLSSAESRRPDSTYALLSCESIQILENSGGLVKAFRINNGRLQEFVNGHWQDFYVGTEPVLLASGSCFTLDPGRKSISLELNLNAFSGDDLLRYEGKGGMYQCRN